MFTRPKLMDPFHSGRPPGLLDLRFVFLRATALLERAILVDSPRLDVFSSAGVFVLGLYLDGLAARPFTRRANPAGASFFVTFRPIDSHKHSLSTPEFNIHVAAQ